MNGVFQDVRFGIRAMLRSPGTTAIAILALALGIGANTTIFTVVNTLLLKPVPGAVSPETLVQIGRTNEGAGFDSVTYPDYADFRDGCTLMEGVSAYFNTGMHLSTGAPDKTAERLRGVLVTGNYFEVLGVKAAVGRLLTVADETSAGASPMVVLSYKLWHRNFGADPEVVGQSVSINGRSYTVIGVAGEGFEGTQFIYKADLWVPLNMYKQVEPMFVSSGEDFYANRNIVWLGAFGRLKPNVTTDQAKAQLGAVARSIEESFPNDKKGVGATLSSGLALDPGERDDVGAFASLLMVTVVVVLLIACANVANLMLSRATARRAEIGIRLALGASRTRLARQLLTESGLLAFVGAGVGILVALWLNEFLPTLMPKSFLGIPLQLDLRLDLRVVGFAAASAILTAILFGLVPALTASRVDLIPVLKDSSRTGHGMGQVKLRGALVIAQVALSIVLLIAAGLFVRTLQKARQIDLGFNSNNLLIAELDLKRQNYTDDQAKVFFRQLQDRLRALSGVQSASYSVMVPLSGMTEGTSIAVEGRPETTDPMLVDLNHVSPGYFSTMEIPILAGRDFAEHDSQDTTGVIVINGGWRIRSFRVKARSGGASRYAVFEEWGRCWRS